MRFRYVMLILRWGLLGGALWLSLKAARLWTHRPPLLHAVHGNAPPMWMFLIGSGLLVGFLLTCIWKSEKGDSHAFFGIGGKCEQPGARPRCACAKPASRFLECPYCGLS